MGDKCGQKRAGHSVDPWVHLFLHPSFSTPKHININKDIAPNPFTPQAPQPRQIQKKKNRHPRLAVNKALLTSPPRSKKKDNKEKVFWPNQ